MYIYDARISYHGSRKQNGILLTQSASLAHSAADCVTSVLWMVCLLHYWHSVDKEQNFQTCSTVYKLALNTETVVWNMEIEES
jgi:hypothetical protein